MKILISGWYGYSNAGDELLLDVFLNKCSTHNITVLTQGIICPKHAKSVFHHDMLRFDSGGIKQWLRGQPLRVIKAIMDCDVFVLGGGGIIREAGNYTNLIRLLDEIWLAKLLGKKVFIYGVSIGPIHSEKGMKMIRKALQKCDYITVRDDKSLAYLKQFGLPNSQYNVFPDPGFLPFESDSITTNVKLAELSRNITENKIIPIFLALGLIDDGKDLSWLDSLAEALDSLSQDDNLRFIALPFRCLGKGALDDVFVANELYKRLKHKQCLSVYEKALEHTDLSKIIVNSECVVTVRLHAMILSIANKTPFVAINYDTKVMDTALKSGLDQQVVRLDESFTQNLIVQIKNMVADPLILKSKVSVASEKMEKLAQQTFTEFERVCSDN